MKKAKKVTKVFATEELKRWCIEMAVAWPTVTTGYSGAAIGGISGSLGYQTYDADVLGRAQKILDWVQS